MSLNPAFSSDFASASSPDAKLTFNISAFNGNTTNFNRCPAPKPKSMTVTPVQPRESPIPPFSNTFRPAGSVRPM